MPLTPETKKNILDKIKKALEKCCPPMVLNKSSADAIEIIGNIPVPYVYKKKKLTISFLATAEEKNIPPIISFL